ESAIFDGGGQSDTLHIRHKNSDCIEMIKKLGGNFTHFDCPRWSASLKIIDEDDEPPAVPSSLSNEPSKLFAHALHRPFRRLRLRTLDEAGDSLGARKHLRVDEGQNGKQDDQSHSVAVGRAFGSNPMPVCWLSGSGHHFPYPWAEYQKDRRCETKENDVEL